MARRPSRGVRLAAALLALMLPLLVLYAWLPVAVFSRRAVGLRPEEGLTIYHWARLLEPIAGATLRESLARSFLLPLMLVLHPFLNSLCWRAYIEFCAGGASPPSG